MVCSEAICSELFVGTTILWHVSGNILVFMIMVLGNNSGGHILGRVSNLVVILAIILNVQSGYCYMNHAFDMNVVGIAFEHTPHELYVMNGREKESLRSDDNIHARQARAMNIHGGRIAAALETTPVAFGSIGSSNTGGFYDVSNPEDIDKGLDQRRASIEMRRAGYNEVSTSAAPVNNATQARPVAPKAQQSNGSGNTDNLPAPPAKVVRKEFENKPDTQYNLPVDRGALQSGMDNIVSTPGPNTARDKVATGSMHGAKNENKPDTQYNLPVDRGALQSGMDNVASTPGAPNNSPFRQGVAPVAIPEGSLKPVTNESFSSSNEAPMISPEKKASVPVRKKGGVIEEIPLITAAPPAGAMSGGNVATRAGSNSNGPQIPQPIPQLPANSMPVQPIVPKGSMNGPINNDMITGPQNTIKRDDSLSPKPSVPIPSAPPALAPPSPKSSKPQPTEQPRMQQEAPLLPQLPPQPLPQVYQKPAIPKALQPLPQAAVPAASVSDHKDSSGGQPVAHIVPDLNDGLPIIAKDEFVKMEKIISSSKNNDKADSKKAKDLIIDVDFIEREFGSTTIPVPKKDTLWGREVKVQSYKTPRTLTYHDANRLPDNSIKYFVHSDEYKLYLFYAVARGDTGAVDSLLNMLDSTEIRNTHGDTPLIYAAKIGNVKMVRYLIVKGAELDATNHAGLSATAVATKISRGDIIEALNEARR